METKEIRLESTNRTEPAFSKNGRKQLVRKVYFSKGNQLLLSGIATIEVGDIKFVSDYPENGLTEYAGHIPIMALPVMRNIDDHRQLTNRGEKHLKIVLDSILAKMRPA